ncbi:hypothetical protein EDM80_12770 [bacterium]|nr:MAG: hypothetical protein EDM80_12770 [bacterium]RIK62210.1 MAG: hypothetical protein DCC64_10690 [Planctomycetota bacterium]
MAQLTQEQEAFLRQRMPEAYAPVREPVVYIRDWLNIKKMIHAAPDPESARLELVGLTDPMPGVPHADLQNTVRKACQAISLDRDCADAYALVARAVVQLSSYDELTVHPFPLREVLPLAQRGRQVGPDNVYCWQALITVNIHLKRWDSVTEQMAQYRSKNLDARIGAELGLLAAKAQELWADVVQWYDKLLALAQTSAERAELHGHKGMAYLKLKQPREADASFYRAMVEGGEISWVAHQWSQLKDQLGKRPAAIELNRRAIAFDPENRAAKVFAENLRAPFRRFGHPFPGPCALDEEKVRGIALAGCDPAVQASEKLKPYEAPKSVTRIMSRRATVKTEGKSGPAHLLTGEGAISLARALTPEESDENEETAVGTGYLQQIQDELSRPKTEKADKKDDKGLLVPRDATVPAIMPNTRTIRNTSAPAKPKEGPASPATRVVRRPPPVPLGQTKAPIPAPPTESPEDQPAKPRPGAYVRPATGQFSLPKAAGEAPEKPPTGQSPLLPPAAPLGARPGDSTTQLRRMAAPSPLPPRAALPIPVPGLSAPPLSPPGVTEPAPTQPAQAQTAPVEETTKDLQLAAELSVDTPRKAPSAEEVETRKVKPSSGGESEQDRSRDIEGIEDSLVDLTEPEELKPDA